MFKAGDILYDDEYGMTVTLIESFVKQSGKTAWKVLVTTNELGYDDSRVGEIVVTGEKHLKTFFKPIDNKDKENG